MSAQTAYTGARIFDGANWHDDAALLVAGDSVDTIVPVAAIPANASRVALAGGTLVPGFLDLQVNGGGGILLGPGLTAEDLRHVCGAHYQFGTTALLPTLITDTPETTDTVIGAAREAVANGVPGFIGLHLEGPHLSIARKGAHNPAYIRPMEESDIARLTEAARHMPNLLVTVAAETVHPEQISRLVEAGIVVSLGHTDADFDTAGKAIAAGASMATHLFNAMSQMGNREPGVVGASLHHGIHAGLIADGIHVHPADIGIALRAKTGPGRIFLVTDAMSQTGTDLKSFMLNGRTIVRANGALRLEDGTLAGADLNMIDAVLYMHRVIGLPFEEAVRMATLYPAEAVGIESRFGHLFPGAIASFVHLSDTFAVSSTWIGGHKVFG